MHIYEFMPALMWEEAGVPGENPCPTGQPPYPITYNHRRSWGMNSGCIDEKRAHCPLGYVDTQSDV